VERTGWSASPLPDGAVLSGEVGGVMMDHIVDDEAAADGAMLLRQGAAARCVRADGDGGLGDGAATATATAETASGEEVQMISRRRRGARPDAAAAL
jgi:hypothetical protein